VNEDDLIEEIILDAICIFVLEDLVQEELFDDSEDNIEGTEDYSGCKPTDPAIERGISFNSALIVIINQTHKEEMSYKEDNPRMYQIKPRY